MHAFFIETPSLFMIPKFCSITLETMILIVLISWTRGKFARKVWGEFPEAIYKIMYTYLTKFATNFKKTAEILYTKRGRI